MGNKSSLMLQDEEVRQISEETGFSPSEIEKLYTRFSLLDRANCGSLSKNDLLSIPELAINPLCDRLIQLVFSECDSEERINFRQFVRVLATFKTNSSGHSNSIFSGNGLNASRTGSHKSHRNGPQHGDHHQQINIIPGTGNTNHSNNSHAHSDRSAVTRFKNFYTNRNNHYLNHQHQHGHHNGNQLDGMHMIDPNDGLRQKLMFIFKVYDADNDGRISFDDVRSVLKMMVGNFIEDYQLDKITDRVFAEMDHNNDGFIEFNDFCKVFSAKDLNNKLRVKFVH